ncbi:hypothetical protein J4421_00815 [Candidatus Woesearchaeota archaeon]|nr:hypothetical protein [Candidatus Woesearchaeota archaeon]
MGKVIKDNIPISSATPNIVYCVCVNEAELPSSAFQALEAIAQKDLDMKGKRVTIPLGYGATLTTAEIVKVQELGPGRKVYSTPGNEYLQLYFLLEPRSVN